ERRGADDATLDQRVQVDVVRMRDERAVRRATRTRHDVEVVHAEPEPRVLAPRLQAELPGGAPEIERVALVCELLLPDEDLCCAQHGAGDEYADHGEYEGGSP